MSSRVYLNLAQAVHDKSAGLGTSLQADDFGTGPRITLPQAGDMVVDSWPQRSHSLHSGPYVCESSRRDMALGNDIPLKYVR